MQTHRYFAAMPTGPRAARPDDRLRIELWCAIAHLRISRLRVWCYAPSRNDVLVAKIPVSLSTRAAVSTTSEAGISRMQRWWFMVQTGRWQGRQGTVVLV